MRLSGNLYSINHFFSLMYFVRSKQFVKAKQGILFLLLPISAMAGGSGYGVEDLVVNLLLYVAGLIAISVFGLAAKDKTQKFFWTLVLAAYVIVPAIYISVISSEIEVQKIRALKENERSPEERLQIKSGILEKHCKKGAKVIFEKHPNSELIVLFKKEEDQAGGLFADQLARDLGNFPGFCSLIGLKMIEDEYSRNVRRTAVCESIQKTDDPNIQSRFELIVGKNRRAAVELDYPYTGISTRSIKIVDRQTGKLMAEDSLCFLAGQLTAENPGGLKQISDLLGEVFARQ